MFSLLSRTLVAISAASLLAAAPATAAVKASQPVVTPWIAYSALAAPASSQALCGLSAAAAAGAAAQGATGCVFPTLDAPVVPPPANAAPIAAPATVAAGGSIGVLPLLFGLLAFGGVAALLLAGEDDGDTQISISP